MTRLCRMPSTSARAAAAAAGLALALMAQPAVAAAGDLALCLQARDSADSYARAFAARGWVPHEPGQRGHDAALASTGEILWTLRRFPISFAAADEVRSFLDAAAAHAGALVADEDTAVLTRQDLSLLIVLRKAGAEKRLTCTLAGRSIPDVARRLAAPGHNPSGEPVAWNLVSSGPLPGPHAFAEVMYVRLFFSPAQHLLTGDQGIVTHLTFRPTATPTPIRATRPARCTPARCFTPTARPDTAPPKHDRNGAEPWISPPA